MSTPIANKPTSDKALIILHTSDWHLGRRLYGRMRYEEFEAFLSWLETTISAQKVDVLIVAGDIFDTMTPSNRAQALYYEFLGRVSRSCCEHIVIVAGNHDSPTFLDAPSQVLKFLNVHVIGTACDDLNEEVLVLDDTDGNPNCIIAAVPYLRDRDVRSSSAGEPMDSKDANVIKGIRAHYDEVATIAKDYQIELMQMHQRYIPIIATGHLFAAGGKTTDDDGVRDLYVGSLGKVSAEMFDTCFDYVALGHLHVPQRVGGQEHIRYSGSPIAMGFGEARQQKQVLLVKFGDSLDQTNDTALTSKVVDKALDLPMTQAIVPQSVEKTVKKAISQSTDFMDDLFGFEETAAEDKDTEVKFEENQVNQTLENNINVNQHTDSNAKALHYNKINQMQVTSLTIPCFQKLAQISGDLTTIKETISATLKALESHESVWLEVIYNGDEIVSELREEVAVMIENLPCEVLKIKNTRTYNKVLNQQQSDETLQDLNEMDVFERCLEVHEVADTQKEALRDAYQQILYDLHHDDKLAE